MCVLRVTGRKFDPERYLRGSTLGPYSVFHAGQARFDSNPKGGVHAVGGFKVDVSRRPWDDLAGQVADAIAFLKKHRRTLIALRSIREVEDIRLDFPLDLRIDRERVYAQFDYLPPELVSLAGALGCGLELSIYPRDFEHLARSRRMVSRKRSKPDLRKVTKARKRSP